MSVVLGFATSKCGIIASDGWFKDDNGKIIDENFPKLKNPQKRLYKFSDLLYNKNIL